ncbi:MAG TPA: thioredoxin [Firmicutes bacterium]|nr:thioredoxin [Bacillota bacterium]
MSDTVVALQQDTFDAFIGGDTPVLVDFWAAWCGPCKMISPVVDEIAQAYAGKVKVGKVNVDECSSVASAYGVMNIPTLVLFKNGKETERIVGFHSKEELSAILNRNI